MSVSDVSETAKGVAMHRAAHLLIDADPKLFKDNFAGVFAGFDDDASLLNAFRTLPEAVQLGRTLFVIRSRFVEDELALAIQHGTTQYVLLGAGLDSFAYRCAAKYPSLRIYDVDSPSTQAWKRERAATIAQPEPETMHFVAADLGDVELLQKLEQQGFDKTQSSFFACLGVTQYLSQQSLRHLLSSTANASSPGSRFVVQYQVTPDSLSSEGGALLRSFMDIAERKGEPWQSLLSPEQMEAELRQAGFSGVRHFGVVEATQQYLQHRSDGLSLPEHFRMIIAVKS